MAEKPIIFSGPMVRAILDGRKTQSRRVVDRLNGIGAITEFGLTETAGYDFHFRDRRMSWNDVRRQWVLDRCPYGKPGDLLWVRETWGKGYTYGGSNAVFWFRADGETRFMENPKVICDWGRPPNNAKWRPSIHMPKKFARLWLRVTDVRCERVQDISEEDALAEGIEEWEGMFKDYSKEAGWLREPRDSFRTLWDSINAKRGYGWEKNPWVWAYTFERVEIANAEEVQHGK